MRLGKPLRCFGTDPRGSDYLVETASEPQLAPEPASVRRGRSALGSALRRTRTRTQRWLAFIPGYHTERGPLAACAFSVSRCAPS
jgi:hypothetical protein